MKLKIYVVIQMSRKLKKKYNSFSKMWFYDNLILCKRNINKKILSGITC